MDFILALIGVLVGAAFVLAIIGISFFTIYITLDLLAMMLLDKRLSEVWGQWRNKA